MQNTRNDLQMHWLVRTYLNKVGFLIRKQSFITVLGGGFGKSAVPCSPTIKGIITMFFFFLAFIVAMLV